MIQDKFRRTVETFNMLREGEKVVAGVSGGSDSVAMLYMLSGLKELSLDIRVAHVNHGLRAGEAERDAEFVKNLAAKLGLEFEYTEVDTETFRKKNRLSTEDAARKLRYDFFQRILKNCGGGKIATAHTQDDQAETVIMRLLRGSGSLGMSAIKPVSGNIIRPLIDIKKSEIKDFLESKNIMWIEDSTNASSEFLRNRVRNELIPLMEDLHQGSSGTVARSARIASIDTEFICCEALKRYKMVISDSSIGLIGRVSQYNELPLALKLGVLRCAVSEFKGDLNSFTSEHFLSINDAIESGNPSVQIDLPGNVVFSKGYGIFCFSSPDILGRKYTFSLSELGNWNFSDDITVEIDITSDISLWGESKTGYFSLERTSFPIKIRSYEDGDRFIPLGMKKPKKVKDFFIDEKMPKFLRNKIPLFESAGKIMWLGGMRIDERFKAREGEKNYLRIKVSGIIDEIVLFKQMRDNYIN